MQVVRNYGERGFWNSDSRQDQGESSMVFWKNAVKSIVPKNPRRMAVCKTIADTIKAHIEPEKENESLPELKIKGLGVSDYKF